MSKIIGQDKLIKEVNRIFQVFVNSNCKIRPHFILTGESGSALWRFYYSRTSKANLLEIRKRSYGGL